MQRPPAKVAVGDRFEDAEGKTYIVTEVREGHPFLLEDFDLLDTQQCKLEESSAWKWVAQHSRDPLRPIAPSPEMTRIARAAVLRNGELQDAWGSVPADYVPDLYNELVNLDMWNSAHAEGLFDPAELARGRKEALQAVVELAGALETAATLLNVDETTLSCALESQ